MAGQPRWIEENVAADVASSTLFKFTITLPNGTKAEINMTQDLDIDYEDLEDQLTKVPSQYAFWAALYSEVKSSVAIKERQLKSRRAHLAQKLIDDAKAAGSKLTDKQSQQILEGDDELNRLEVSYALAQKQTGKLWHMIEATRIKSEHLRSLAGFKRQEQEQAR